MEKIALIMAAGEGTRMKSATPKTLHEICGVPMLEHVMRAIEPVCKEQAVIVGYGKDAEGNDLPKTVISREFSSEWEPGDEPYYRGKSSGRY